MIYLFNKKEELMHIVHRKHVGEAVQEKILNGLVTVSLVLPASYYEKELKVDMGEKIGRAYSFGHFDNAGDFQLYKIIHVAEPNHIEVLGVHVAFDELQTESIIKDRRLTNSSAENALGVSLEGSRWEVGEVEELGEKSYTLYYVPPLEAIDKWRKQYQAETRFRLTFDGQRITGRFVDGVKQVGRDTGKRFVYGHNALEVVREQDFSEIYTAIIGRGKGEETLGEDGEPTGGYGRRIGFEGIEWTSPDGLVTKPAGQDYIELPERTALYGHTNGEPRFRVEIFDDIENPYELLEETYAFLLDASRPRVLFHTTVERAGSLDLGDRVHIIRKDLDIHYTTRVQKVVHNLLNENLTTAEVGDYEFFRTDKRQKRTEEAIETVENEVEEVRSATRSRFEQTDESITLAVERMEGENREAWAQIEITVEGIRSEVGDVKIELQDEIEQGIAESRSYIDQTALSIESGVDTKIEYLDGRIDDARSLVTQTASSIRAEIAQEVTHLDGRIDTFNSSISQLSGQIALKADSSTVTNLGTEVRNLGIEIDAVSGEISSKVSYTDYTGTQIASRINQSAALISISAEAIDLSGIVRVADSVELGRTSSRNQKAIKFNGNEAWIYSTGANLNIDSTYINLIGYPRAIHPAFASGSLEQNLNPVIVGYSNAQRLAIGIAGNYLNVYDAAGNMRRVRFE